MAGDDHVLAGILVGEWCRCRVQEQEIVREVVWGREPVVEHELVPVHMFDGGFGHDGDRARDGGVQSKGR